MCLSSYNCINVCENKSAYYLSQTCPWKGLEHVSDGVSERVNFQSSSKLNWFIMLRGRIKSFSIFASALYQTFYYQGENKPCHTFQKNLTKPGWIQIWPKQWIYLPQSSRNCFKYSEKHIASIHENFLRSLAFILFTCKNVAFYVKQDFSASGFPQPTLSTVECSRGYSIYFSLWNVILNCNQKGLDLRAMKLRQKRCYTYVPVNIFTSKNLKWGRLQGTGNPG